MFKFRESLWIEIFIVYIYSLCAILKYVNVMTRGERVVFLKNHPLDIKAFQNGVKFHADWSAYPQYTI